MKEILTSAFESGGRMRVKSALNPILWMCAIVSTPCVIVSSFYELQDFIVIVCLLPIPVALLGFFFLLLFDRDKLQSEEFQIKKRSLEIIEQSSGEKVIEAASITLTEKPDTNMLGQFDE